MRMGRHLFFITTFLMTFAVITPAFSQNRDEEAREYLVRGTAAIEMAKNEEDLLAAAEEFKKATEIAPNMAAAWYNLGSVQSKTGHLREAITCYQRYLTLVPQSADTLRVKDEIIKLKYKLERTEKVLSLSGTWVDTEGSWYGIKAEGNKMLIQGNHARSTDDYSLTAYVGVINMGELKSLPAEALAINLTLTGKTLAGYYDVPSWHTPYTDPCTIPAEKGAVEGSLDDQNKRMVLKLMRSKYKVVEVDPAFFGDKACKEMSATEQRPVEMVFLGPLPPGLIGCSQVYPSPSGGLTVYLTKDGPAEKAGIVNGDEIIAIDGAELAQLKNPGERIVKLRGQPGSTVKLTVKRKEQRLDFTVQRIDASTLKD